MYLAKRYREPKPGMVAPIICLFACVVLLFRASFSAASAKTAFKDKRRFVPKVYP